MMALAILAALSIGTIVLVSPAKPDQHGAQVLRFTIHSAFVHQALPQVEVVPPGTSGRGRPLLVFLHGRGAHGEDSNLSSEMFKALADQGRDAPDVVFPDGGDASYWHNRSSGQWASYVIKEVVPAAIARVQADPRRVAIGGLSMGGFGALDIARLSPGRFCAVAADSAALWFRGADAAPGAFDDAADFGGHDLIRFAGRTNPYGATPVWMDVGTDDPFRPTDTALARELRADGTRIQFNVWPGGHDGDYWRSHWQSYLGFYARHLQRCRS